MNIIEKSKEYAEGKALNAITSAIEEAYAAGYKAGFSDGCASKEKTNINDVEFKDLGLPSGTKWAVDYIRNEEGIIRKFTYEEAQKFNLPTYQQIIELCGNAERSSFARNDEKCTKLLGANGQILVYPEVSHFFGNSVAFWLKDEINSGQERMCCHNFTIDTLFMGHKLPVLMVRQITE